MWNSLLTESKLAPSLASFLNVFGAYEIKRTKKANGIYYFILLLFTFAIAHLRSYFCHFISIIVFTASFAFW